MEDQSNVTQPGDAATQVADAPTEQVASERQPASTERTDAAAAAAPTKAGRPAPDLARQFAGLQGTLKSTQQQLETERQARLQTEQRLQAMEAQSHESQWRMAGLSPEQIQSNRALLQAQQRLDRDRSQLREERQRLAEERASMEQPARVIVAHQIAERYGNVVPTSELLGLSTPDAMEAYAQAAQKLSRSNTLQERRVTKVDKAESGGGSGVDVSKMNPQQKIAYGLKLARTGS